MEANPSPIFERLLNVIENVQFDRQECGRDQVPAVGQFVAPFDFTLLDPRQINGGSLPTRNGFRSVVVVLDPADSDFDVARLNFKLIADVQRAAADTTGHHGTVSFNRERAIDRHTKRSLP